MDKSQEPKVTFKYIFDPNYNPEYVNGAQGGVNPKGEIIMNFYLERFALPNSQTHALKDNSLGPIIGLDPEDLNSSFVRMVKSGVVMNLQTAKDIYQWLGGHIARLEEIEKQKKED